MAPTTQPKKRNHSKVETRRKKGRSRSKKETAENAENVILRDDTATETGDTVAAKAADHHSDHASRSREY